MTMFFDINTIVLSMLVLLPRLHIHIVLRVVAAEAVRRNKVRARIRLLYVSIAGAEKLKLDQIALLILGSKDEPRQTSVRLFVVVTPEIDRDETLQRRVFFHRVKTEHGRAHH